MSSGRARPAAPTSTTPAAFHLPASVLLDGLDAIAGAQTRHDVAEAVCAVLMPLPGVRAIALVQRDAGAGLVMGSAGYSCEVMAAGARLPLDSGLPVAEAIRTGELIRQGEGPGWCAVPFGRRTTAPGALLLSLTAAPPADPEDLDALRRLAAASGRALDRAARTDRDATDRAALVAGLSPTIDSDESRVAVRQTPRSGPLGGDVALAWDDEAGGTWLVVADVCGSGLPAATGAAAVRTAVRALAPGAESPAHLLRLLDRALRPESPEGGFVTAVVAQLRGRELRAASAGHPAPVVVTASSATTLPLESGPPLALDMSDGEPSTPVEHVTTVPEGGWLLLYSDGLTDRRGTGGAELDIDALLPPVDDTTTPTALADAIVAAAQDAGPADDDSTVLVCRL